MSSLERVASQNMVAEYAFGSHRQSKWHVEKTASDKNPNLSLYVILEEIGIIAIDRATKTGIVAGPHWLSAGTARCSTRLFPDTNQTSGRLVETGSGSGGHRHLGRACG